MARTAPTVAGALAVLASAQEPDGSPLTPATLAAVRQLLDRARADVASGVEAEGVTATAARLGVSRSTLKLWRAHGWLA